MAKLETRPGAETSSGNALERIYGEPGTGYALDLVERFAQKSFDETSFKTFLNSLPAEALPERAKLERLLADPSVRVEADLSTRGGQMVWAAGLGFLYKNSPLGTTRTHPIWKTLTRNSQLSGALTSAARFIDLSITNRNATMDYGTPGSWFWYSPDKNHINIDLFHTLVLGFSKDGMPNAMGVKLHEVGHALYTTRFTDKMKALAVREAALLGLERAELEKLEPQEFQRRVKALAPDQLKEFVRTRKEFQLRADMFNAAEDNTVNRYSANQSRDFPHDFGGSLNVANVVLQGAGATLKRAERGENAEDRDDNAPKEVSDAKAALSQINKALMYAFYTTNGLFETSDASTWKKLGVDIAEIKGEGGGGFDELMSAAIGKEGLANLQPASRDRMLLRHIFTRSVETYADRRCKLVDDLWDKYAAKHAQVLIDAAGEDPEKEMKGNQPSNSPGNGEGNGEQQPGSGGQGKNGDDPSPSQGGGQSGGQGGMDSPLPATPEQARQVRRRKSEQENKPDAAKAVRDLVQDAKKQGGVGDRPEGEPAAGKPGGKAEGKKGGKPDSPESEPEDFSLNPGGSVGERKVDLAKLSGGDWKDFRKRVNELEPVIARVADDFIYIRDKQRQVTRSLSKQKEELPRGGDIDRRLDMRAQMNFAVKRASGQKIEDPDRRRWKKDEVKTEPTSVELWILGDGSGSTRSAFPQGGGRRIDAGLQTMAILEEAGKRADFEVFAGIWENNSIRMLAEPGMPERKIGENFEAVRQSGGVGTIYNTPLPGIIDRLSKQTTDSHGKIKRFAGMTHFLWIVDGTQNDLDVEGTAQMLLKLFRYGPSVSVDIAYLGGYQDCETKMIVERVKQENPKAQIDTLEALNANDAPVQLVKKIKKRFEQSANEARAVPDAQKREAFSTAYKAMRR